MVGWFGFFTLGLFIVSERVYYFERGVSIQIEGRPVPF